MTSLKKNKYFEVALCPVCASNNNVNKFKVRYFNDDILPKIGVQPPIPETYIKICQRCRHHYASPQLSDSALNDYYSEVNSEYYLPADQNVDKLLKQHLATVKLVEKYKLSGSVLEIGCGYGYLLSLFNKDKWQAVGVEPFGSACDFASKTLGLTVIHGYLDKTTFKDRDSFDVIMLFDVMEHLKDAKSMKELIDYYLKPDGLLVIGTGDISSLNAKFGKDKWAYLTLREHVSFFSKESINYWLKPYEILEINNVSYIGSVLSNLNNFFQNIIIRKMYNIFQSLHYPITKFKLTKFSFVRYVLAFDHMLVISRKNKK